MENRVLNVCKHILSGELKPDFLFGHRGVTIGAFCFECEPRFRESESWQGILEPIPEVEALRLGIPELVGSKNDEASVYGR